MQAYRGYGQVEDPSRFTCAVERLLQANSQDAMDFWRHKLCGITEATELGMVHPSQPCDEMKPHEILQNHTQMGNIHDM